MMKISGLASYANNNLKSSKLLVAEAKSSAVLGVTEVQALLTVLVPKALKEEINNNQAAINRLASVGPDRTIGGTCLVAPIAIVSSRNPRRAVLRKAMRLTGVNRG